MPNAIDILIRAAWQGRGDVESARRDLQKLGGSGVEAAGGLQQVSDSSQRTGRNLASLAITAGSIAVALGATTRAAKEFFDRLEQGAGLELTAQRFDRLAERIGTTGIALRTDLIDATEGMVSSAQAMALATDLVGLGLTNTHDETVRLARVVTELDADIGELTLALANQTTRRFDQLGISLEGFNERLERLQGTMSDEEAFTMAFLEQAEAQIEKVGGASQTTAGDIRRLQADWAALNEEIDIFLAKEFGPALALLSGRTGDEFKENADAAAEEAESIGDLSRAYSELEEQWLALQELEPTLFQRALPGFEDARITLLRGLANMTDSAEEFEREAVRIFGPRGFSAAIRQSGEDSAEAFFNTSEAIREAESADRVLIQAHEDLVEETEAAANATEDFFNLLDQRSDSARNAAGEISRLSDELQRMADAERDVLSRSRGGVAGAAARAQGAGGTPFAGLLEQDRVQQERLDLFGDFQDSITAISDREAERRTQLEEQHEARRTDIVAEYNRRREEEEEDFARRQRRQEEQLARDIADVREDTAERQAELRDDANRRIAELEEDHLQRMADIANDASLQLQEAASRLDATAVQRITQQRDQALEEEEEQFADQRENIEEELARRLEAERVAAEERIQELNEFHDRRQQQEEEDRTLRLEREREAHERQLAELDSAHAARLTQLQTASQAEIDELTQKYEDEHELLTASNTELLALEKAKRDELLAAEEAWWNDRIGLATGASGGGQGPGGVTGASGGGQGFPGSAPFVGATGGSVSLSIGEINVNTSPGQDAEEVGGEVVRQIDNYMINLMAGGP